MLLTLISTFSTYFSNEYSLETNINTVINIGSDIDNYYLLNSYFNNFNSRTLYTTKSNLNILIESCIYSNCYYTGYGGAIYYSCSLNGGFVLNKVCAYRCSVSTTNGGLFAFISTSTISKNICDFSSIIFCAHFWDNIYFPLWLLNGYQEYLNSNCSYNLCYGGSGLRQESYNTCLIKFNSLINNSGSGYGINWFIYGNNNFAQTFYCNFLNPSSLNCLDRKSVV